MRDKTVLITGANSGIGAATARLLVQRGANVVLGARREEALEQLARELGPEHALTRKTDVTSEVEVVELVQAACERFGRIDAVFANAGIGGGGSVASGDPSDWRSMLLTNVYGLALTVHHALKPMLEAGRGHIILASSVAGRIAVPGNDMYSATKFAVNALGEGLRSELAGTIKVTLLEPGAVRTPFFSGPLPVALLPEDIAELVVYCLEQPEHVEINELLVRPRGQAV